MAYKIAYTAFAERDIWEIADYLSDHSMMAAEKFLRTIKESIEHLAEMPLMYPKIDADKGYHKMVAGDYVVVYVVGESLQQVVIIRVAHGKRNYQNVTKPSP